MIQADLLDSSGEDSHRSRLWSQVMSPTILRERGYRFFFFSREEPRIHVHVYCGDGEAKYWLEPTIELAKNHGLSAKDLRTVHSLIEEHEDDIRGAWAKHFGA
jgi:hypothetical protein